MSEATQTPEIKTPKTVELTIAGLQADLKAGLSRKAQAEKYGLPLAAINRAYKNEPALKGKRVFSPRGTSAVQVVFTDKANFSATEANPEVATVVEAQNTESQPEAQSETPVAEVAQEPTQAPSGVPGW